MEHTLASCALLFQDLVIIGMLAIASVHNRIRTQYHHQPVISVQIDHYYYRQKIKLTTRKATG